MLEAPQLAGSRARLEPLTVSHVPALLAAASEDPSLYAWNVVPTTEQEMDAYVREAISGYRDGVFIAYAIVRQSDDRVVGSTRYNRIEHWRWPESHPEHARATPDVCEIGYTWLARSAIRTGINTDAKRLLLTYAFEAWRVHRVALRTDVRNARSRAAIERLGAKLDGIVRAERAGRDGAVRDSALYSIIASEWPAARTRLASLVR
jgi:RimJ/RimL family protein N-acetyltransferase